VGWRGACGGAPYFQTDVALWRSSRQRLHGRTSFPSAGKAAFSRCQHVLTGRWNRTENHLSPRWMTVLALDRRRLLAYSKHAAALPFLLKSDAPLSRALVARILSRLGARAAKPCVSAAKALRRQRDGHH